MQEGEHGHVVDVAEEEVESAVDDGVEAFVYRKAETEKVSNYGSYKKKKKKKVAISSLPFGDIRPRTRRAGLVSQGWAFVASIILISMLSLTAAVSTTFSVRLPIWAVGALGH